MTCELQKLLGKTHSAGMHIRNFAAAGKSSHVVRTPGGSKVTPSVYPWVYYYSVEAVESRDKHGDRKKRAKSLLPPVPCARPVLSTSNSSLLVGPRTRKVSPGFSALGCTRYMLYMRVMGFAGLANSDSENPSGFVFGGQKGGVVAFSVSNTGGESG